MSPTSSSTGTSSCRCRTSRRSTARAAATRRRTIGHRAACATTSATRSSGMSGALLSLRNVAKAWLLLLGACLLFAGLGYLAGGLRLLSALVFCCLLLAAATYWYVDRVVLGMLGARELLATEAPALHSTAERLAAVVGLPKPRLYLLSDPFPRALSGGRGPRGGGAIAVSSGLL